ncbi:MAG: hypothetical protein ACR2KX_15965 [Chitinophagaceae bacterium]
MKADTKTLQSQNEFFGRIDKLKNNDRNNFMKYLFISVFLLAFFSCENRLFDKDKRQLIAKDEIRRKLIGSRSFDITGFKEDTLSNFPDSTFKHPIRYMLDFVYKDSDNVLQKKRGIVIFTPDGNSIINSGIIDSAQ